MDYAKIAEIARREAKAVQQRDTGEVTKSIAIGVYLQIAKVFDIAAQSPPHSPKT